LTCIRNNLYGRTFLDVIEFAEVFCSAEKKTNVASGKLKKRFAVASKVEDLFLHI